MSEGLVLVAGGVFQNVCHAAGENPAQVVDGSGGNGLIFAELVDGGAGETVVFDEGVGGLPGGAEGFPKGVVADHGGASFQYGVFCQFSGPRPDFFIVLYVFPLDYSH